MKKGYDTKDTNSKTLEIFLIAVKIRKSSVDSISFLG